MTVSPPLLARAATYVAHGWHLLPLVPGGKEPHRELLRELYDDTRVRHLQQAPAIYEEVAYWFETDPTLNLGVIPCPASSLVIVDVDQPDLFDAQLLTPTAVSGREGGGKHLYFSCSHEVRTQQLRTQGTTWGDLNPAHVVLPGSIHKTGRTYEWLPGLSSEDVALMPFDQVASLFTATGGVE